MTPKPLMPLVLDPTDLGDSEVDGLPGEDGRRWRLRRRVLARRLLGARAGPGRRVACARGCAS